MRDGPSQENQNAAHDNKIERRRYHTKHLQPRKDQRMTAAAPRPEANYTQMPATMSKTSEIAILGIMDKLVEKGILTIDEALSAIGSVPLLDGINSAHQIGMALRHWRDTLEWLHKQRNNKPKAA
jgi:hypothetical protein